MSFNENIHESSFKGIFSSLIQSISFHSMSYTRSDMIYSMPFHYISVNLAKFTDFISCRWLLLIQAFTIYIQLLEDALVQDAKLDLATVSGSSMFSCEERLGVTFF